MFIFKKKDIVLDCFTHTAVAYDHAKIGFGTEYLPIWWEKQPGISPENWPTVKHCPAVKEFFEQGIVIPSWFEMDLSIDENGMWTFFASNAHLSTDSSHPANQFPDFAESNGHNIKITSVWRFRTKEDIKFTYTQPTWHWRSILDTLVLLPAIISFKYQPDTNVNLFVTNSSKDKKQCSVKPLTPLAILHPLTERKVVIKNHLVDEAEYKRLSNVRTLFLFGDKIKQRFNSHKVRAVLDRKGCPFK